MGYLLAYTIASEIGDIARFASPKKLTGYTGLCRMYVEQIIANLLRNAAKFQDPFIIKRDRGASGRPRITGAPGSRS